MIQDYLARFCAATSVADTAQVKLIGNVIDLKSAGLDLGAGGDSIRLRIVTTTEVITAGSAGTLVFKLVSDAQEALAVDGSATVHITSATLVTDDAAVNSAVLNVGGVIIDAALPLGTYERYLGIIIDIGTTEVTAGAVDAYLVLDSPSIKAYPDAI